MQRNLMLIIITLSFLSSFAQKDSSGPSNKSISNQLAFSAYLETYYSYDFNKPLNHEKPSFFYNHNRTNEFSINLALLKTSFSTNKVRANLSLGYGTYMNANYISEPATLKNIYEANIGLKIKKQKNLWIDAGVFSSHIGFESAVSKDCWTLTRSILGENSPYYESGAKITYVTDNNKWLISGLLLNGWQRITRINANSSLNIGTQIQFKPDSLTTINYSTFIGSNTPDSSRLLRYFNNLYAIFNLSNKVGVTLGFDLGFEQGSKFSSNYNKWYSPIILVKYIVGKNLALAARAEYYNDINGVIINTPDFKGLRSAGYSFNIDYNIIDNALIRFEIRDLYSKDNIYYRLNSNNRNETFITTSFAISF